MAKITKLAESKRRWYLKHRERLLQNAAIYRETHREKARAYALTYHRSRAPERRARLLLTKYGITSEDYDLLLASQGGVCAICQQPSKLGRVRKVLFVDHDHATGKIRGLLCDACNYAIGKLGDTPEGVMRAYRYLVANS